MRIGASVRVAGVLRGAEEAHAIDRHRLAVVEELEVGGGEVDDRLAVRVGDDRVDLHEVRAAAEDRRGLRRLGLRRLRDAARSVAAKSTADNSQIRRTMRR